MNDTLRKLLKPLVMNLPKITKNKWCYEIKVSIIRELPNHSPRDILRASFYKSVCKVPKKISATHPFLKKNNFKSTKTRSPVYFSENFQSRYTLTSVLNFAPHVPHCPTCVGALRIFIP